MDGMPFELSFTIRCKKSFTHEFGLQGSHCGYEHSLCDCYRTMIQLATAKKQDHPEPYLKKIVMAPKPLIIDGIIYLPFGREEACLFF
jgi:hypothetical protein|tara:strand:+ start:253 stop:516 length:264 start_codon:yes stop_codon:yes gene_type:complete